MRQIRWCRRLWTAKKQIIRFFSNNKQNEIGNLLVVVPLSRSVEKIYPSQVVISFDGEKGRVKCEQVRTITSERLERKLGTLDKKS